MQTLRTLTAAPSFQWSYTKLSCFEQCPCAFKLKYLDSAPTHNNAFAEYGSYCHA